MDGIDTKVLAGALVVFALLYLSVTGAFGPQTILGQSNIEFQGGGQAIRVNYLVDGLGETSLFLYKGTPLKDGSGVTYDVKKTTEIKLTPKYVEYRAPISSVNLFSNQPDGNIGMCSNNIACFANIRFESSKIKAAQFTNGRVMVGYDITVYQDGQQVGSPQTIAYPDTTSVSLANGNVGVVNVGLSTSGFSAPNVNNLVVFFDALDAGARFQTADTTSFQGDQFSSTRLWNCNNNNPFDLQAVENCRSKIRNEIRPGNAAPFGFQSPTLADQFTYSPNGGVWKLPDGSWNAQVVITINTAFADIVKASTNYAKPQIQGFAQGSGKASVGNTAQWCWNIKNTGEAGQIVARFTSSETSIVSGYDVLAQYYNMGETRKVCTFAYALREGAPAINAQFCGVNVATGEQSCMSDTVHGSFTETCTGTDCGESVPTPPTNIDCRNLGPDYSYNPATGICEKANTSIPWWIILGVAVFFAALAIGFKLKK